MNNIIVKSAICPNSDLIKLTDLEHSEFLKLVNFGVPYTSKLSEQFELYLRKYSNDLGIRKDGIDIRREAYDGLIRDLKKIFDESHEFHKYLDELEDEYLTEQAGGDFLMDIYAGRG